MLSTWESLLSLALVFLFLQALGRKWRNKNRKLPPGPPGLPILGNLHMLGKLPHHDLHRLGQKYGEIMYMRLGIVPTIVVSSPKAAQLFLKTHDLSFASRPPLEAAKHMAYGNKGIAANQYGPYWRSMRKFCIFELFSTLKIKSFRYMRREELGLLVESLKDAAKLGERVNLSSVLPSLTTDLSCRMLLGKRCAAGDLDEMGFTAAIREVMQLFGVPNVSDFIPCIGILDLQGFTKRMRSASKVLDDFLEKIIDKHAQEMVDENKKDFVHAMLDFMRSEDGEFSIDRSHVKAVVQDMLLASIDTTATAIEWALAELLKHPRVMTKVQKELKEVVGLQRMVEESDLECLEYLDMVIKETLRLHPVAPLLAPHQATEECFVAGFHISNKSRIIINAWAIGRDPNVWSEPEKFFPERFQRTSIDLKGNDFQLIPFGSGRRQCPGMQLGLTLTRLVVAQLVHCFDWELPDDELPEDLDMSEAFGITVGRAKHLLAVPTYRICA